MRKGSIVLVPFPFTDLSGKKVRPAVVLFVSPKGEDFISAFISSVPVKGTSPYGVSVQPSTRNGLKVLSHIKIDKIATLQKNIAIGELGTLEPEVQNNIDKTLRSMLAL